VIKIEKATFGAGCFWGVEYKFSTIKGVIDTKVGYAGGKLKNPTYEDVCTDNTGHAEVVQVVFNPSVITYENLVDFFWKIHDPTQLNRQGPDIGSQYKSVIFYHNEQQKIIAKKSKEKLENLKKYKKPIVTEIIPIKKFYPAEEYHQRYLEKKGL